MSITPNDYCLVPGKIYLELPSKLVAAIDQRVADRGPNTPTRESILAWSVSTGQWAADDARMSRATQKALELADGENIPLYVESTLTLDSAPSSVWDRTLWTIIGYAAYLQCEKRRLREFGEL